MEEITNSVLVKNTTKNFLGKGKIEVLERPASYIIRLKYEPNDRVTRIIILSPKGFTSNEVNETSPHPETRRAKITIKGGIRADKKGFNILKNVIKFAYYTKRNMEIEENYPYAKIDKDNPAYKEEIKSSKESFFVVKESGEGFYHNLINLSNEWILLILKKELRLQKEMDIVSKTDNKLIIDLVIKIGKIGDNIFDKDKKLIDKILELNIDVAVPPLIEALNIHETGKHEPCTVYAIILKFAKKDPNGVLKFLKNALEENEAPRYYLKELIGKIIVRHD